MLIGYGVGIFVPLLAFNATVEAPILGHLLGVKFSELWWPWFKANVWSLLGGIPVLIVNSALKEWWLPTELGARVSVYPIFLIVFILVYRTGNRRGESTAVFPSEDLYARSLTKPQRRALRCWINPRTGEFEVLSETSLFRALRIVTSQQIQAVHSDALLLRC